jgi:hypothetical protein
MKTTERLSFSDLLIFFGLAEAFLGVEGGGGRDSLVNRKCMFIFTAMRDFVGESTIAKK